MWQAEKDESSMMRWQIWKKLEDQAAMVAYEKAKAYYRGWAGL